MIKVVKLIELKLLFRFDGVGLDSFDHDTDYFSEQKYWKSHMLQIYQILGVSDRTAAATTAMSAGLFVCL